MVYDCTKKKRGGKYARGPHLAKKKKREGMRKRDKTVVKPGEQFIIKMLKVDSGAHRIGGGKRGSSKKSRQLGKKWGGKSARDFQRREETLLNKIARRKKKRGSKKRTVRLTQRIDRDLSAVGLQPPASHRGWDHRRSKQPVNKTKKGKGDQAREKK